MRREDIQRVQRKETVYEKYRHAESTNKGDGEKKDS